MITAILDANVLYPAPLRDYLLNLADIGLFKPAWSADIREEWIRNVLKDRPDLKRRQLEKTQKAMDAAFPDANIDDYTRIIGHITLPDRDDRHVLAAAITANASIIVTENIKDFPGSELKRYEVQALRADDFVLQLIIANKVAALLALDNQVALLRNPPLSKEDVLKNLARCGLKKSVEELIR